MSDLVVLGVTATRNGITDAQRIFAWEQLAKASALHHGACVGGDEALHDIAQLIGLTIYIHPPINEKLMMPREKGLPDTIVFEAEDYHPRNHSIVDSCEKLLVLPDGPERMHSGTWSTFRYA